MQEILLIMNKFISDVSDSAAKNSTNIIVRDEVKIETVIIILWVAGGALLLTLLILLICILRNNKKTGAQCGTGYGFSFLHYIIVACVIYVSRQKGNRKVSAC